MRALREWIALPAVVLVAMAACSAYGQQKPVTFEWDCPGCVDDGVVEFVLYESTDSVTPGQGTWSVAATVSAAQLNAQTELTVNSGKHAFYVTARNTFAESGASNVVTANTQKPRDLIFRIRTIG